jgi:hypothetical protein
MTHAEIIKALGGPQRIASELGIASANTVAYWARDGRSIPSRWWPDLVRMSAAIEAGITVETLAFSQPRRIAADHHTPTTEAAA